MHLLVTVQLIRQGIEQAVALRGAASGEPFTGERGEGAGLTIASDLAGIQAVGFEYGELGRVGSLLAGGHGDSWWEGPDAIGEQGVFKTWVYGKGTGSVGGGYVMRGGGHDTVPAQKGQGRRDEWERPAQELFPFVGELR